MFNIYALNTLLVEFWSAIINWRVLPQPVFSKLVDGVISHPSAEDLVDLVMDWTFWSDENGWDITTLGAVMSSAEVFAERWLEIGREALLSEVRAQISERARLLREDDDKLAAVLRAREEGES